MPQIVLSAPPADGCRSPAQLAVTVWLTTPGSPAVLPTWISNTKQGQVRVDSFDPQQVVVEYPVIHHTDETFTAIIVLPLKGNRFVVDQPVPYLSAFDYMSLNQGKTVVDLSSSVTLTFDQVVSLATDTTHSGEAYRFAQEDGKTSYLLCLTDEYSAYHINQIMVDIFGQYLPWEANGTWSDPAPLSPPTSLDACYIGQITVNEPVVPSLKTINLISLPLIARHYRHRPLNYDGQYTYNGTQTYLGQVQ